MAKAKTYEEVIAKRKKIAKRDRRARRIQVVILSILLVFIALSTAGFAYAIYAKFTTIEEFILLYQNVPLLIITAARWYRALSSGSMILTRSPVFSSICRISSICDLLPSRVKKASASSR